MWIPFAILAIATISIGVVGFAFEDQLHSLFAAYLSHDFGIVDKAENSAHGFLNINPTAALSSLVAFGVGGFLGYIFYIQRRVSPEKISENVVSKAIWRFLYNRWYIKPLLYWIGVVIPLAFYRRINNYFENLVMTGINSSFQYSMAFMSKVVKVVQTGNIQTYLYVFSAGVIIVSMLLFM
jgi:NADH-quinone oxidoreductase subunit L